MLEVFTEEDPRAEKLREWDEAQAAKVEAQAFFTAVMTDTYLEEGEDVSDRAEG